MKDSSALSTQSARARQEVADALEAQEQSDRALKAAFAECEILLRDDVKLQKLLLKKGLSPTHPLTQGRATEEERSNFQAAKGNQGGKAKSTLTGKGNARRAAPKRVVKRRSAVEGLLSAAARALKNAINAQHREQQQTQQKKQN
ncbi:MAG: hypothetical protein ACREHD_20215 [Pirellulales bacterium]